MSNIYVVATPIGNLDDMSPRAIETLKRVDLIAAEDTRHSGRLLQHFAIDTPATSLHEHNERDKANRLLERVKGGESLALISDAGTPLISDPGFHLLREARKQGVTIVPIPGACALITALSAAGLPTDKFIFEGFLPAKSGARLARLQDLATETRTIIFYESTHRIHDCLTDCMTCFGETRVAVLAKELTKHFETIIDGSLVELKTWLEAEAERQKGEFVILIKGFEKDDDRIAPEALRILDLLAQELPLKKAAKLTADITGEKKNRLYDVGLGREKMG
ncbi:MAG: 16S rRNA (cytidine(1402)-2'-O)-methyltransferase [Legionellales bacterium]|nr:16S rRNA (cytidine(1402)-2'-O)-methyltransferase [Legionellales bacterium]|tara:strand:+ start:2270 stop:3106 length:837 start_codon:yes stop_codon:yes gene_type:complete